MSGRRRDGLLLLLLFVAAHVLLYRSSGIVSTLEAEKYVRQADLLLKGSFPGSPKYYYYLPIIYLIAFAQKFGLGYSFVVGVQTALSLASLLAFYRATERIFSRAAALVGGILLCVFLPYFSWDFYLYSESLFFSGAMLLYYCIARLDVLRARQVLPVFGLLAALLFTRPFGVLFIPPVFVYLLAARYRSRADRFIAWGFSLAFGLVMLLVINRIFHGGEDMDAMKPFVEEHVVCFVPQKPQGAALDLHYYDNGLRDIGYYIVHNPGHFARLMALRLWSFFSMTRPWYSRAHNVALAAFLIPVYAFFFVGIALAIKRWKRAYNYLVALLILYPLAVTFQCDDWHARFTMPVLVPVFAFAAFAATECFRKLRQRPVAG
ncbi:glycosyltransferase family protein [Flaviaesturariibacter terrae]